MEDLLQYLNNRPKRVVNYSEIDIVNDPNFNRDVLKEHLANINNISDQDAYNLIKQTFRIIISDIFDKDDKSYMSMFLNIKFLNSLTQVLFTENLSVEDVYRLNKIVYAYFISNKIVKEESITMSILALAKNVNKFVVNKLIAIGIDEVIAIKIAVSRYSDYNNESNNVNRMNLSMLFSSPDIFTPQKIIDTYQILFDSVSTLFSSIMYDVYLYEELESISECAGDIYANISLAIIDILNSMTSQDIRKVLMAYTLEYGTSEKYNKIRFSIYSISMSEYARIYQVVEELKKENIFVP